MRFFFTLQILLALLFPPWSSSGGSSAGYYFISSPPRTTAHINSSLLFLQLLAIALISWFLFFALKTVTVKPISKVAVSIIMSIAVLGVSLFAWSIWPKTYSEAGGVRISRFTGTRYVWSQKKGWITEADKNADDLATAKPVLDELSHMVVERDVGEADHLFIYNPTHWALPYSDTELTVKYYRQKKGGRVLLKIIETHQEVAPGINNLYLAYAEGFLGTELLLEQVKITARAVHSVGSEPLKIDLVPGFLFEYQRVCQIRYTPIQSDPLTELTSDDPQIGNFTSKVVCRRSN